MNEKLQNRLLFFITSLTNGGAERQLVDLALALKEKGWEVAVLCMVKPEKFQDKLKAASISCFSAEMARSKTSLFGIVKLYKVIRYFQPTCLISFNYHPNVLGNLLGRIAEVPFVVTSVRNEKFGRSIRDYLLKYSTYFSSAIVVNSDNVAQKLIERKVLNESKVSVIPNGVILNGDQDSGVDSAAIRSKLGIFSDEFFWLAVGSFKKSKDYPILLEAFSRLSQNYSKVKLSIIGQGLLEEEIARLVSQYTLEKKVTLLGSRDDVKNFMKAADAFVLSSAWEGMPNVLLEALASGTPVVATNVGGASEIVVQEKNGYLVPPKSAVKLQEAMQKMMNLSLSERRDMGCFGQKYVKQKFSFNSSVESWNRLLSFMHHNGKA